MIKLDLYLSGDRCLNRFKAAGHAMSGIKGEDILCAAVTVLLRTAAAVLFNEKSLGAHGSAANPGEMEIELFVTSREKIEWLQGVTDFLVKGLHDLKKEYPGKLEVNILTNTE